MVTRVVACLQLTLTVGGIDVEEYAAGWSSDILVIQALVERHINFERLRRFRLVASCTLLVSELEAAGPKL